MQTETGQPAPAEGMAPFISDRVYRVLAGLLLAYFAGRLLFFALGISPAVPPDEVSHAGLCRIFSRVWLLPVNGPDTYQFGMVTNTPWLYYWLMGKLSHLNLFGVPELVFLRLWNIPLAFGTLWYALRLARLAGADRLVQLLLLAVLTNTPMFSFLSASVSYDNLANLLAAMAIYYAMAFLRTPSGLSLGASLFCQLAGCLTKNTLLPLVLVLDLILLGCALLRRESFRAALKGYFAPGPRAWLQLALIVLALGLNLQLYGGNYLSYRTLSPSMENVVSTQNSMQNRIAAREKIFYLYLSEQISYLDALQMAGNISHPGDKADTFFLLMNYQNLRANPSLWLGPGAYTWEWLQSMVGSTLGIKAHLPMFKSRSYLVPVYLLMALSLVGFALRWRPKESGWFAPCLLAVPLFYAGFLLVKINYPAYGYYGTMGIALQGRYLFPVLVPMAVFGCRYLLGLFRAAGVRAALAVAVALLFVGYDFPWFLAHAGPQWYSWFPG